jgi:hypothetical protein
MRTNGELARRLIVDSSHADFQALRWSPNGHILFIKNAYAPLFLVDVRANPETGVFLSQPETIAPLSSYKVPADLVATADGRQVIGVLSTLRQPDVYVGGTGAEPVQLTNVRRLTLNTMRDFLHSWMADN